MNIRCHSQGVTANISSLLLTDFKDGSEAPSEERAQWNSPLQFFFTILGFCVGLGNIWRFPYLCQANGGGKWKVVKIMQSLATLRTSRRVDMGQQFGQLWCSRHVFAWGLHELFGTAWGQHLRNTFKLAYHHICPPFFTDDASTECDRERCGRNLYYKSGF